MTLHNRSIRYLCSQSCSQSLSSSPSVVNSFTEWDPLEEVIVGCVKGATVPELHSASKAVIPKQHHQFFESNEGTTFPQKLIDDATSELNYFCDVLKGEGVIVKRPDPDITNHCDSYQTPDFSSKSGMYSAMPRDVLLVVGDEIIEAPMAWRSRYFEYRPYRKLIKNYFKRGARWTAAPKPQMSDHTYNNSDNKDQNSSTDFNSTISEYEPCFDAAEFTRLGKDIFCQVSHVTNKFGIQWLQRHLSPKYNIHVLDFSDKNRMHIDGTFIPLCEGKLLINPTRPCRTGLLKSNYTYEGIKKDLSLPIQFKGWDVLISAKPTVSPSVPLYFTRFVLFLFCFVF